MKKTFLYTLLLIFTQIPCLHSQPYNLEILSDTYVDLSNSISLNNGEIWDDPEYAIPIGFDFQFYGFASDSLFFSGLGGVFLLDTTILNDTPLLVAYGSDIIDRGEISGTSESEISYKTEGVAGSRILKVEWKNVGFYDEVDETGQSNSFVNFQLWLYEGSNAFEIRFGPTEVENEDLLHDGFEGPLVGFVDSLLLDGESFRRLYYLTGKAEAPVLHQINSEVDFDTITTFLIGNPPDGIIYRFSDLPVASYEPGNSEVEYKLYPAIVGDFLTIETNQGLFDDQLRYAIFSADGRVIRPVNTLQHNQLRLEGLMAGYYYLQLIEAEGRKVNLPFVKR